MSWELAIGRWGVQLSVGLGHLSRYLEGRVTVLFPEVGDGGDLGFGDFQGAMFWLTLFSSI